MAHAYAAVAFGDPTPRIQGRLTMNPVHHLEWFGSVIVPLLSVLSSGFWFGWAKPVTYNPYNLQNRRIAELCIALAGPFSNVLLALIASLLIHTIPLTAPTFAMLAVIVGVNVGLAVFNMLPIPPLDGSKVLAFFLPPAQREWFMRQSLAVWVLGLVIIIVVLDRPLGMLVAYLRNILIGI